MAGACTAPIPICMIIFSLVPRLDNIMLNSNVISVIVQ